MLIDSHAHLDLKDFKIDLPEVLERAFNGGLSNIITVGIDLDSSLAALELARKYPPVFASVGFHPHVANICEAKGLDRLAVAASEPEIVAWGKSGSIITVVTLPMMPS